MLRRAGNDLTRANIMRTAANLKDYRNPTYRDGILNQHHAERLRTVKQAYLARFDGTKWVQFGELLRAR